jgi:hypothetical protein
MYLIRSGNQRNPASSLLQTWMDLYRMKMQAINHFSVLTFLLILEQIIQVPPLDQGEHSGAREPMNPQTVIGACNRAQNTELDAQDPEAIGPDVDNLFADEDDGANSPPVQDEGEIDDSDDESAPTESEKKARAKYELMPTIPQLEEAMEDLKKLLRPPRCNKRQTYKDPGFDKKTIKSLEAMKLLCFNVLELERKKAPGETSRSRGIWTEASVTTARSLGHSKKGSKNPGKKKSKELRRWLRLFIDDRKEVPTSNWSTSGRSLIDDEDFAQEVQCLKKLSGCFGDST